MSVPLISSVGFTAVNSAGTLNEKAGTSKSKLPIQVFRLTDNINGNLTMTDDSAHKKIILDTNGFNIINPAGSPITNNSSTTINLKGSGEVKSTLLTFTSAVTNTNNTGTTTISEADNSTVVVAAASRAADISLSGGVSVASGSNGFRGPFSTSHNVYLPNSELIDHPPNNTSNDGTMSSAAITAEGQMETLLGSDLSNINSDFSITLQASGISSQTITGDNASPSGTSLKRFAIGTVTSIYGDHTVGIDFVVRGTGVRMQTTADMGAAGSHGANPTVTNIKVPNATVATGARTIAFTNNLAISVVLSGADPFDNVTVAAGATNTQTVLTTDGSFNIIGTISGSDGSSRPYALKDINDGSGSVDETEYTGTKSVSAF